jgi:hypothetical protein
MTAKWSDDNDGTGVYQWGLYISLIVDYIIHAKVGSNI